MFKVTMIGNLSADPVLNAREWTNKETAEIVKSNVCNFTVAANEGRGQYKQTQFFRVNAWRGLGDLCAKYLTKGRQVYVEGVPSLNNYVDKNNQLRSVIEIRADRIDFLQDGKHITATETEVEEEPTEVPDDMPY